MICTYIICIKDLISNKWREIIIPLSRKFYVQLLLKNKTLKVILKYNVRMYNITQPK